ncbi:MAG TPA: 5-oxoprolinase subunit PxpA, partial [Chitinophagaceae bacterium]|nr:5-oxoprolinase subunit PxpA [Chitinophagaceae bacterium]
MHEKRKILTVDLNCDMGEGIGNDADIMPFISSANIPCGYHAGDEETMKQTIELCLKHNVAIGAHPSFLDRENFGRNEQNLEPAKIYELVLKQISVLDKISKANGATLHHVKPHGALYNLAAKNAAIANAIALAVKEANEKLALYGLSGSKSIEEAKKAGLQTASEVFADRTYQDDGSLTSRKQAGALVEDVNRSVEQALEIIIEGTVTSMR